MAYAIQFKPAALRQLAKLPREIQKRVASKIEALGAEPFPAGCKKLHGKANLWRIRAGDYRVIYQVHANALFILVVSIGNRREVYR